MIILKIGDEFPRTCEHCPLFVDHMGFPTYCAAGGEYTDEEIEADENGSLNMYYHGYLSKRPQNCPLQEARDLLDMPIPEPKIETYRLATLHAWVEIDAEMVEILKPEELDRYLRDHLAHKIADEGIKPRLKIEKKYATPFGIHYETELTIKEEPLVEIFTPEGGKA